MTDMNEWIGRAETRLDDIVRSPAARLAATLGTFSAAYSHDTETLPPLWHWLFFLDATPRDAIGPDGHAAKGGFLPPIELPRRMYAGGRFAFPSALRFNAPAEKHSTIASIAEKKGRSGPLAFVTVRHEILQDGVVAATEEHDIVYREAADPAARPPEPPRSEREIVSEETVTPDEVMLFRFSALTFNGHRIHYDFPYVTGTEGYPGLIVHGPLIAMMLFEAARRDAPGMTAETFEFRAVSPFFCGPELRLVRTPNEDGKVAYEARRTDDTLIMTSRTGFAPQ
ncbi:FAS1-like dehydratase domain-containing protein [Pararhizobium haloflavum]|uniref:FAS1-like dehydratase domain-containing protein n=1 Tax=Pararhizobium haloflavum TaxID=2037914 RepID=UPI000C179D87|nr:MaoC family dehydratase N-terminal domain-containing protein [Pararhizobium haloflavum]